MAKRNCAKIEKISKYFVEDCSPLLEAQVLYFLNAVRKKGDSVVISGQTSGNMYKKKSNKVS